MDEAADYPGSWPSAAENPRLEAVYRALWQAGCAWDSGQDWQCPAHSDQRASLGVRAGDTQPVLLKCQAGCTAQEVLEALGLPLSALSQPGRSAARGAQKTRPARGITEPIGGAASADSTRAHDHRQDAPTQVRRWFYTDEAGARLSGVGRKDYEDGCKRIGQIPVSGVKPADARYVLYDLAKVLRAAKRGGIVVVTEGETGVQAAQDATWPATYGYAFTCHRNGAGEGKWRAEYTEQLAGVERVYYIADRDLAGYEHAARVHEALGAAGIDCAVLVSRTKGPHDDLVQHIDAGGKWTDLVSVSAKALRKRIEALREVKAAGGARADDTLDAVYQNRTDTGNARRMVSLHRDVIRYSPVLKCWFVWDGKIWARDTTLAVMAIAKATVVQMHREALELTDDEARKTRVGWCLASESTAKLKAMAENAQSDVVVRPEQLNSDPFLLTVQNGTLDLKTGELRPHSPLDLITFMAPVTWTPEAKDARWEQALDLFVRPDEGKEEFLRRAAFASLTGDTTDKAFVNLYDASDGNTGKTTVIESLLSVLGPYGVVVGAEAFLQRAHGMSAGIRSDLASCAGKRMVVSSEIPVNRKLDSALMKKLTAGAGTYSFEEKYANPWQGRVTFTIWLDGNSVARAPAEDHPLFNRWRLTPFKHKLAAALVDPKWVETVCADPGYRSAVLAWAMDGRAAWWANGMGTAPSIEAAGEEVRAEMDPLRDYWESCCVFDTQFFTPSQRMRESYENWCAERGERQINDLNFQALLKGRGVANKVKFIKGRSVRGWSGVRVIDPV